MTKADPGTERVLTSLVLRPADLALGLRMATWLAVLPLLKRLVPLSNLVRLMWSEGGTAERSAEREARIARLAQRLGRATGTNCLTRSLVLYRFLARANAEPRLVIGLKSAEHGPLGHAWVAVDGRPVLKNDHQLDGQTAVTQFGPGGRREEVPA